MFPKKPLSLSESLLDYCSRNVPASPLPDPSNSLAPFLAPRHIGHGLGETPPPYPPNSLAQFPAGFGNALAHASVLGSPRSLAGISPTVPDGPNLLKPPPTAAGIARTILEGPNLLAPPGLAVPFRARPLPVPRAYALFISHAWGYSGEYQRFIALLDKAGAGFYRNLSIPQSRPVLPNPALKRSVRRLMREIDERIRAADCLLVLSGMYCSHSEWIQSEIEAAQEYGKPIIGVQPFGQERVPQEVRGAACEMVGWRTESIIAAIRRHSA
jgi:hypothetical protein